MADESVVPAAVPNDEAAAVQPAEQAADGLLAGDAPQTLQPAATCLRLKRWQLQWRCQFRRKIHGQWVKILGVVLDRLDQQ